MTLREALKRIFWPYRRHKSRTVRYAFPLLFLASALLAANAIDTQNESYVYIQSDASSVQENDTFEIRVFAYANEPVNAVDIQLAFPPDQVEVTGIDIGQSVITLWTEEPYIENGSTVVLRGGTFRKGFKGEHLIAVINARAKESGLASFEVTDSTFLAGDGTGAEVTVGSSGREKTKLVIANADGSYSAVAPAGQESGLEASVTVRIVPDIDGDGQVTLADISRFITAWRNKTEIYDFSGDGEMTFRDFAIILAKSFMR